MTIYTVFKRLWFSTKKHCESPETRNIGYHRYHKNIRYHWYHKKWNTSHEKGTISKRRVRLVPKHLHVKVIKLFQPWGDRLWQFWKHPLSHLGGKNERETNLFGRILWFCEALIVQHIFYFGPGECCPQRESAIFAPFLPSTQASWARNRISWRGSEPHSSQLEQKSTISPPPTCSCVGSPPQTSPSWRCRCSWERRTNKDCSANSCAELNIYYCHDILNIIYCHDILNIFYCHDISTIYNHTGKS